MGNLTKLHHLRNSDACSLEEMPKGFSKLTCLLTLGRFVVGKDSGSRLRELKSLTHLQGTLQISKLENVKDVGDASDAQLNSKVNLKALLLEWSTDISDAAEVETDAAEDETRVLDMLKPHQKLEELTIAGYGGKKFPTWLGDSSFSKLVLLRFEGCCKCTSLPSVGQLPLLKHLKIIRMNRVKSVGLEFYGNSCSVPFPSLETLCFENMPAWKEWIPRGADREVEEFPKLRMLSLVRCSKLQGSLPERLPLLEKLVIKSCERFPQAALPSQLRTVEIDDCNALESLPEAWMGNSDSSLQSLEIGGCNSLVSFPEAALPFQLRTIKVARCDSLKSLPEAWMGNSDSSLQSLEIRSCLSIISFPEAALPSQMRTITIVGCNALRFLPESWMQNSSTSLESLEIRNCNSLTYIARIQLPPRLKKLMIENCRNLRTLTAEQDIRRSSSGSNSPTSFSSESELPATLEVISIGGLENLQSLPTGLHNLHRLQKIRISSCPNLESFPEGGLPSTKLTELKIWNCENLKALPSCMHNLTSLLRLETGDCPSLVSFPEDGFPTNLQSLGVYGLKISKPLFEWGLNRFTSLRELKISRGCPGLVSSARFPASLTTLEISNMPNLKRLSSIGQNLTSLETEDCPKLKYFSKQGLPKSLLKLIINDCPLMEKRCRKDKGKYWPMITHIPYVEIDDKLVFEED